MGDQLHQEDTKRPDVRLDAEAVEESGLGCRPLDGELGSLSCRVLVVLDHSGQTKVCDLDDVAFSDQDVPGGQVPVDVVLGLEEGHPTGRLGGNVYQLWQFQVATFSLVEVVQQAAVLHELSDNVDRFSLCAHGVELDEFLVLKLLHDLRFCEEVLNGHGARL